MYVPGVFAVEDREVVHRFLDRHSFGTLVSVVDGQPFATHLPMLFDREKGLLLGHVARANPHWRGFDGEREALAIFQGPHAYISPAWYVDTPAVPTWNYAAVHVYGAPRLLTAEALEDLVARLVGKYEDGSERPWQYDLPEDFRRQKLQAIVGFAMPIARLEGKFKFGQNRSVEDRRGMLEQLRAGDAEARLLAAMIAEHLQE
jgi:transcriptional regulator